ncbi:DUF3331 domain-containing protein [Burkholderia sp. Ac-20384]|uniref:DUF3331 domain-containing protein n=1 Tax=Burkholderia sp. Ac-20384 TaxID=2703902 RepID=UPI001F11FC69|nr:DUF3331 domain-containing protein [Burkholderia sp. Ac-20384]
MTRRVHEAEWIPQPVRVVLREVRSTHTVSICWSDSQTGHYDEQIWRLGFARNDGLCVISGQRIVAGDKVWSPRRSAASAPANWNRMILASEISLKRDALD